MKKNKLLIILITILFLPFSINAVVRNNYDITKENTNLYINDFSRNNIYIIKSTSSFNVPFIYNNGTLSVDTYFKNGGLLNRYEFLVSKSKENDTYLFNGNNYWTLTSSGDKVYMIDSSATDNISLQEKTVLSGGRVTEYIREETGVSGSGKYTDPWVFIDRFKVTAKSSNTTYGTVTPTEKYVNKGETLTFNLSPASEYEYSNNDCGATYSNGKLILSNIQADKNCIVNFKKKVYKLTYNNNGGSGCTSQTVTSGNKWGTLCTPKRTNYSFLGWFTSATGGTKIESTAIATKNQTVYAHWEYTKLKLTYNNNGGSGCSSKTFTKNQKVGTLCVPTKASNEFAGWYTSATGGTKVTSETVLSAATTVYAHWTPTCFAFTPSTGTITDYYDYKGNNEANGSCSRSVTIPSTISGKTVLKIGNSAFKEKNITSVTIPNTVTEIGYDAFYKDSITSLTIPSSVKKINRSAFYQNNISSLTLNEGLTYIGSNAFYQNKLTALKTPSTLTKIDSSAFYQNNISSLTLNEGLTYIGGNAFSQNKLTSLKTPRTLTKIEYSAFYQNSIETLTLNEGLTYIGSTAFYKNKLTTLKTPSTLTKIDNSAFYQNNIATLRLNEGLTYIGGSAFSRNKLTTVTTPSTLITLDSYAFSDNQITSLTLNDKLTTIGDFAFSYNKIPTVTIPKSVTSLGNASFNSNQLPDSIATFYKRNSDGSENKTTVVSYGGSNRTDVIVPSTVKTINPYAYYHNYIRKITLPEGLTKIDSNGLAFNSLSEIKLPSTINYLGSYALYVNILRSIDYNNSVITYIGTAAMNSNYLDDSQAFIYAKNSDGTDDKTKLISYGGANRSTVTVPNSVKEIGDSAFFANWIKSVIFPEGLEKIGTSVFSACSLSGSITLPSTVTSIGNSAFIKTTLYNKYNEGIAEIVNKTGKSFKWHTIFNNNYYYNQDYPTVYHKDFEFETGTVINPAGDITISK